MYNSKRSTWLFAITMLILTAFVSGVCVFAFKNPSSPNNANNNVNQNPHQDVIEYDYLPYLISDDGVVTAYTGSTENVATNLPATYSVDENGVAVAGNTYQVKEIAANVFKNVNFAYLEVDMTNISSVGANAFQNAKNVHFVNCENGFRAGDYAFENATVVFDQIVLLADSDTQNAVGECAFANMKSFDVNLAKTVPTSNIVWADETSYATNKLTTTATSGYLTIGASAFNSDSAGLAEVDLSNFNGILNIETSAFNACSALKKVELGGGMYLFGNNAFKDCTSLGNSTDGSFTMNGSLTSLGTSAFEGCSTLSGLDLSLASMQSIGASAFKNCSNLSEIFIPATVERLGSYAFAGCSSWTSFEIPTTVTEIGQGILNRCVNLETLTLPFVGKKNYESDEEIVVDVGAESTESGYDFSPGTIGWIFGFDKAIKSSSGVVHAYGDSYHEESATYSVDGIDVIDLVVGEESGRGFLVNDYPYSLFTYNFQHDYFVNINGNDYRRCIDEITVSLIPNKLTNLTILPGCKSLCYMALGYDGAFQSGNNFGDNYFGVCNRITELSLPDSISYMGMRCLSGCALVGSIIIPKSVADISHNVFDHCDSLNRLSFGDNINIIRSIPQYLNSIYYYGDTNKFADIDMETLFYSEWNLYFNDRLCENLYIQTTRISMMFNKCRSLKNISLYNVSRVCGECFEDCSNVETVEIKGPNQTTELGFNCFHNLTKLKTLNIDVENIICSGSGSNFHVVGTATENGVDIIIGDNLESTENLRFSDLKVNSIIIGNKIEYIGEYDFSGCYSCKSLILGNSVKSFKNTHLFSNLVNSSFNTPINGGYYIRNKSGNPVLLLGVVDENITSFEVLSTTKIIGSQAFQGCSSLNTISLYDSLISSESCSFYDCSNLSRINYYGSVSNWNTVKFNGVESHPLGECNDNGNIYFNGNIITEININNVNEITCNYANCGITTVSVGSDVATLDKTFYRCYSLNSISFSETSGWYEMFGENSYKGDELDMSTPSDNANNLGANGTYEGYKLVNIDKYYEIFEIELTKVSDDPCMTGDTLINLADGTFKQLKDITYDDELLVLDHDTGLVSIRKAVWIHKSGIANGYQLVKFSDGSELKFIGLHAMFNADLLEYVDVQDAEKFNVGTNVVKVGENNQLSTVSITSIEYIEEEVEYYEIITSGTYNVFANNLLTSDGYTIPFQNMYEFNADYTYKSADRQAILDGKYSGFLYTDEYLMNVAHATKWDIEGFRIKEWGRAVELGYVTEDHMIDLIEIFLNDPNRRIMPEN